jgi:hypothetical protein
MNPQPEDYCAQYLPQWQEKIGHRLFPATNCDLPETPFVARDCLVVRVKVHVSWPDRIRLLLTGRAIVESKTVTENHIGHNATSSCAYVLPPRCLERKP